MSCVNTRACVQFVTLLQFLSSFSKLLRSCVLVSKELIGQMDFLRRLLTSLVAVLMLDTKGLGQSLYVKLK